MLEQIIKELQEIKEKLNDTDRAKKQLKVGFRIKKRLYDIDRFHCHATKK